MKEAAMKHKAKSQSKTQRQVWTPLLERIEPNAAGIDCGAQEHYVAVPADRDPQPVQAFRTFTADLKRLTDWLAGAVRDHDRGDGIDRGLLDSAL
jgi:transposase